MLIYSKSNDSYDKITLKWFDLFFQKYKIYKTKTELFFLCKCVSQDIF